MKLKNFASEVYKWALLPLLYLLPIYDTSHMHDVPLGLWMIMNLSGGSVAAVLYFAGFICLFLARILRGKRFFLIVPIFGILTPAVWFLSQEFQVLFLIMCSIVVVLLLGEVLRRKLLL